jgi:hypothetical protein
MVVDRLDFRVRTQFGDVDIELYPRSSIDAATQAASMRELARLVHDFKYRQPRVRRVVLEVLARLRGLPANGAHDGTIDFDLGSPQADAVGRDLESAARAGHLLLRRRAVRSVVVPLEATDEPVLGPESHPESPPQQLFNPRWSVPRVEVGAELSAIVSHADTRAPVAATIVVSEMEAGGKKEVARIRTNVPAGTGDHAVSWSRSPDDAHADLGEEAASRRGGPLEYRFHVESLSPTCAGESGPLWLTNTVTVNLVKELNREKHQRARVVVLRDAVSQESRVRSKDGSARFEKVLVGPVQIRVATPSFASLSWSAPQVPVGKPVETVFRYQDAVAGMKALVVIYEVNHDGSETEIDSRKVELSAVAGEARASFTRTEDQAEQDVVAHEPEGDTRPLAYRFRVVADGEWSQSSEALWLTHAVSIKLADAAGRALAAGLPLVLAAADGTEHRAVISGGKARFDDVVFGPMTVKLERAATEAAP